MKDTSRLHVLMILDSSYPPLQGGGTEAQVRTLAHTYGICATSSCSEILAAGPSLFSFYVDVSSSVSPVEVCNVLLVYAGDDVVVHQNGIRAAEGDPKDGICHRE